MGFRSTFCMEADSQTWPLWFRDKYKDMLYIPEKGPVSPKFELKIYDDELMQDIRLALLECNANMPCRVAILHECGGVTLCDLGNDGIAWSESRSFYPVESIEHHYCYNCTVPDEKFRKRA